MTALPAAKRSFRRAGLVSCLAASSLVALGAFVPACADERDEHEHERAPVDDVAEVSSALVSYDCTASVDTGYKNGQAFPITVVKVDGLKAERESANAFLTMAQAAEGAGISLRLSDGFRTMAEQEYYWGCFQNQNCNDGNKAAAPGYSNHQSGHAFDIKTGGGAVDWLRANGGKFGFSETVSGEPWHWEWWGGGNPQPFCATSCDRSEHGFTFSCDGAEANRPCVLVNEPGDPDSWGDNYFCSPREIGMKWSINGPIAGMECVNVAESADPHAGAWADNYLCLPDQTEYTFAWSSAGPLPNAACVHWNEPSDAAHSWGDNYLCIQDRGVFHQGRFSFSGAGPVAGRTCLNVNEPADPDTWADNFFCTEGDFGLKWAAAGPIAGMTCTAVAESADQNPAVWADNFLCAPKEQTPWTFSWSSAGRPAGKDCVHWYEGADVAGSWADNWLCYEKVHQFSSGMFTFSENAAPAGKSCVAVNEPADPDGWADNFFCTDQAIGLKWSAKGAIAGMRCTNVFEPSDKQANDWKDNFLCVPEGSPVTFTFSAKDPIAGQSCVRWFDHAEPGIAWTDNWLCAVIDPTKAFPDAEAGGAGGSGSGNAKAGAAGSTTTSSGGASASSGGQSGQSGLAGQGNGASSQGVGGAQGNAPSAGSAGATGARSPSRLDPVAGSNEEAGSCAVRGPRGAAGEGLLALVGIVSAVCVRRRSRDREVR